MANYAEFEDKMKKTLVSLEKDYAGLRAGRANPAVLDRIRVEYYGASSKINEVAAVRVPEPRMLMIQPWDASVLKEIERAILASDIGINPTNDGKVLRLTFPQPTEERRRELAKDAKNSARRQRLPFGMCAGMLWISLRSRKRQKRSRRTN